MEFLTLQKMIKKLLFVLFLMLTPCMMQSMEVEEALETTIAESLTKAGIEDTEGTLAKSIESSMLTETTSDTFEELDPTLKSVLQDHIADTLNEFKESINSGSINGADVGDKISEKFINTVKQMGDKGEIGVQQEAVIEGFKGAQSADIQTRPNDAVSTSEVAISSPEGEQVAVLAAADNLKVAYQAEAPEVEIQQAEKSFAESQTTLEQQGAEKLTTATDALNTSQTELETTAQAGEPSKTLDSAQEVTDAQSKADDTQTEVAQDKRLTSKQELDAAREKLNVTKTSLDQAKTDVASAQKELDDALKNPESTDEQKTALKQKVDELTVKKEALQADYTTLNGDTTVEGSVKNLNDKYLANTEDWALVQKANAKLVNLKDAALAAAPGLIAGKLEEFSNALWQSVVFMIPGVILSQWQSYMGTKAAVDTLKEVQTFGNIIMKLPLEFINYDQPAASKFVYVGLPSADTELTDSFLKTANYYVAKPAYGDPGSVAITDPSFSNQMIHLNTGYVFMGNGQAVDPDNATLPLVEDSTNASSKDTNIRSILEKLSSGMTGGIKTEVTGLESDSSTHYAGNATIAKLFTPSAAQEQKNSNAIPPLLQATFNTLQNGTAFGSLKLQGITDLSPVMLQQLSSTPSSNLPPEENSNGIPYVAQGIYIYQTQDTPLVQSVLATLDSSDPNAASLRSSIVDYVVMLDRDSQPAYGMVPLEIPLASIGATNAHFASYQLSPAALKNDNYFAMSLLDFTLYSLDFSNKNNKITGIFGTPPEVQPTSYLTKILPNNLALASQIKQMAAYIDTQRKYGPFHYGAANLSIDKSLADQNVFVYKHAGALENKGDDYLVAVGVKSVAGSVAPCLEVLELPSPAINFFVSLVTSRFYDKNLNPYQAPVYPYSNYYIVAPSAEPKNAQVVNFGTKRQPSSDMVVYARPAHPAQNSAQHISGDASASLFGLFVDGDVNTNSVPTLAAQADTTGVKGLSSQPPYLPVPSLWALNGNTIGCSNAQSQFTYLGSYLQTNAAELYKLILTQHDTWKKTVTLANSKLLERQVGSFNFANTALSTISLSAVSAAAVQQGNYVYVSPSYPDEFLVMADDITSLKDIGSEFNDQRYAISLSSGAVYDSTLQGTALPTTLDIVSINTALAKKYSLLPSLAQSIKASQSIALAQLMNNLVGPAINFGSLKLYINRQDYEAHQYIYADVQGLAPLNSDGTQNDAMIAQVQDYFVGFDPQDKTFGKVMSGATKYMVSLISGSVIDRAGVYITSIDQFNLVAQTFSTPLAFTQNVISQLESSSKKPLRAALKSALSSLAAQSVKNYEAQKAVLEKLQDQDAIAASPLNDNIAQNLALAAYEPENSMNPTPRLLKKLGTKYYRVVPSTTNGKMTAIIDYAANAGAQPGSYEDVAVVYHGNDLTGDQAARNLQPMAVIRGQALQLLRAQAGVVLTAPGTEVLSIALSNFPLALNLPTSSQSSMQLVKDKVGSQKSSSIYYNSVTDNFYLKQPRAQTYTYIDLASGNVYNADGSAQLKQTAVYSNAQGALLYPGRDSAGITKFLVPSQSSAKNAAVSYSSYSVTHSYPSLSAINTWAQGGDQPAWTSFSGAFNNKGNDKGVLYLATNDHDTADLARIGHSTMDSNDSLLDVPYYTTWNPTTKDFIDKYSSDHFQALSFLIYSQTRAAGAPITSGSFVKQDAYGPESTSVQRPVGLVLSTTDQKPKYLLYGTNLVLVTNATGFSTQVTEQNSTKKITVSFNQDASSKASWLTVTDGAKSYDYTYCTLGIDATPFADCNDGQQHLWCLQNSLDVYVTPFVGSSTGNNQALVSSLSATLSNAPALNLKGTTLSESQKAQIMERSAKILLDAQGMVYTADTLKSNVSAVKRFVVKLTPEIMKACALDNTNWNGYYVDIANGILYAYTTPVGRALLPSQLAALLDWLGVSVSLDANKLPDLLIYRS